MQVYHRRTTSRCKFRLKSYDGRILNDSLHSRFTHFILVSLDRGNSMGDEQLPIGVFGTVICGICVALEMRIIRVLRTILRVKF